MGHIAKKNDIANGNINAALNMFKFVYKIMWGFWLRHSDREMCLTIYVR